MGRAEETFFMVKITRTMGSPNTENGAKRAMDHGVRTDAKIEISLSNGSYSFLANSYRWVEF